MQVVLQENSVEVHQEDDLAAAEAEVGAGLCFVHWQDALDGFQLQENAVSDNDVGEIGLVQADVFVEQDERDLPFEFQAGVFQLPAEAVAIGCFQQAGAELRCTLMARPMMRLVSEGPGSMGAVIDARGLLIG